jgi:hypothetical protein
MLQQFQFRTARDVFEAFPVVADDMAAGPSERPPLDFLSDLAASPTPEDAITFCAYLLPRREAVWWGHQCLSSLPEILEEEDHAFLALAENWVREPNDEQRYAALDAGMASPTKTPGAWVALGAGWSGGSMVAADASPVAPPPYLTAKAINAAVLGALARIDVDGRAMMLRTFLEMGVQLLRHA